MSGPGGEEPNDGCGDAYFIAVNRTHQFLPDDLYDWFTFVMATDSVLSVAITEFTPLYGQVAAYRGESCGSATLLANYGDPGTTKTLALGQQPAGSYYLFVSNDGTLSTTQPYQLTITAGE